MKTIQVEIQGIAPGLLMNRFPTPTSENPPPKTGKPDWQLEAETRLYKDEQGVIYEPASHLEGTLKEASKTLKIPGGRGATYSKVIGAAVSVEPDAIPHKIQEYEIDSRPVVVMTGIRRARVIRYRPFFKNWGLSFEITVADDQIPTEVIKMALDHAGLYVGIGDFRPGKSKGKFGKFIVTSFKEI